jgi:putative transposase
VISLWEHREVKRLLRDEGRRLIDEAAIFARLDRMQAVVDEAAIKSKKARRQSARAGEHRKIAIKPVASSEISTPSDERSQTPVTPFEVEEWS